MIGRSNLSRILVTFAASLASAGFFAACGGSGPDGFANDGGAGNGNGNGGGSGTNLGGGNGGGGATLGDAACASSSSRGQQLPLDMYVMLDQSGSMSDSVAGNTTKWAAVTSALSSFVTGTGTTGISVGLQYFGLPPGSSGTTSSCPTSCQQSSDCGSGGGPCVLNVCLGCIAGSIGGGGADSCTGADYAKPEVEIAPLPGVGSAITASLAKHSPSTSTPTYAALQGAVDHAQEWSKAHTGDVVVAVLATDGDPTECDTNLADIDAVAAAGLSGTPKVLTFVIGVGTSTTALNGIAAAGGTNAAFLVDTTKNVNQQFLDALNAIRGTALGCSYSIPVPPGGAALNFSQVNVQYTSSSGTTELIPNVPNAAACPATGDAWYYDDNNAPTKIVLCANTCATVEADKNGDVQILLGCGTVAK